MCVCVFSSTNYYLLNLAANVCLTGSDCEVVVGLYKKVTNLNLNPKP